MYVPYIRGIEIERKKKKRKKYCNTEISPYICSYIDLTFGKMSTKSPTANVRPTKVRPSHFCRECAGTIIYCT